MKKVFLVLAASLAAVCCAPDALLVVDIANKGAVDRNFETIEIDMAGISVADPALNAENIVVLDRKGRQLPCQVYTEASGLETLVFQASVPAGKSAQYYLAAGEREMFDTLAFSRYVPERADDFAYENNVVAGRVYGPALADPRTLGSDIWVKCTDALVVNKWFREDLAGIRSYHHNGGEGMDCYKVGNTLGGGALVPVDAEGHLVLGDNYCSFREITSGPVRTKAVLDYSFPLADGVTCLVTRELTLDANTHFVKSGMKYSLSGDDAAIDAILKDGGLKVALGAIQHDVIARADGENWIAFTERSSDTQQPEVDGDISVGLVLGDKAENIVPGTVDGHAALLATIPLNRTVYCWTASGWSLGGVESADAWTETVKEFAEASERPLVLDLVISSK